MRQNFRKPEPPRNDDGPTSPFWTSKMAANYFGVERELKFTTLFPALLKRLGPLEDLRVVDYGCGNGALTPALQAVGASQIDALDRSQESIRAARTLHSGLSNTRFFVTPAERNQLANGSYHLAILSLVLVTVQDAESLAEIAKDVSQLLVPDGRCVVADTHPVFRDSTFSTMKTHGFQGYRQEGHPFSVELWNGDEPERTVQFDDFHHSLEGLTRPFFKLGFVLNHIDEIYDNVAVGELHPDSEALRTPWLPPFIIFDFQKMER